MSTSGAACDMPPRRPSNGVDFSDASLIVTRLRSARHLVALWWSLPRSLTAAAVVRHSQLKRSAPAMKPSAPRLCCRPTLTWRWGASLSQGDQKIAHLSLSSRLDSRLSSGTLSLPPQLVRARALSCRPPFSALSPRRMWYLATCALLKPPPRSLSPDLFSVTRRELACDKWRGEQSAVTPASSRAAVADLLSAV